MTKSSSATSKASNTKPNRNLKKNSMPSGRATNAKRSRIRKKTNKGTKNVSVTKRPGSSKITVVTATVSDIKKSKSPSSSGSLSPTQKQQQQQRHQLVRVPSKAERMKLYEEAARAIEARESQALPSHGGRPWKCHVKVHDTAPSSSSGPSSSGKGNDDTSNDKEKKAKTASSKGGKTTSNKRKKKCSGPLFRWYRGKLELACLPHILDKIPVMKLDGGGTKRKNCYNDESDEEDEVDDNDCDFVVPKTDLSERNISSLSTMAWNDPNHPIPTVERKWESPDHVTFNSRKAAMEHAAELFRRDKLIDRVMHGLGAGGAKLKPFKPARKMALEAGYYRFLRDGLWVVGQEEEWQKERAEEILRKEQRKERKNRLLKEAGSRCSDVCIAEGEANCWNGANGTKYGDVSSNKSQNSKASEEGEKRELRGEAFRGGESNRISETQSSCVDKNCDRFCCSAPSDMTGTSSFNCVEEADKRDFESGSYFSERSDPQNAVADEKFRGYTNVTPSDSETDSSSDSVTCAAVIESTSRRSVMSKAARESEPRSTTTDGKEEGNIKEIQSCAEKKKNDTVAVIVVPSDSGSDSSSDDEQIISRQHKTEDSGGDAYPVVVESSSKSKKNSAADTEDKYSTNETTTVVVMSNGAIVAPSPTVPSGDVNNAKNSTGDSCGSREQAEHSEDEPVACPQSPSNLAGKSRQRIARPPRRITPSSHWRLNSHQIELCYSAAIEHYEKVMYTVKARALYSELQDGFDVFRERGRGRYDMELPVFENSTFDFLTDPNKAPWMPVVRKILGEDVSLIHKGVFLSMPGSDTQVYHQDGPHLTTKYQRPCHAVNVFIPLVDLDSRNGPTEFCLGTHILGYEYYAKEMVETPLVRAGTPVIFDYRLGHRGMGNSSCGCRPIVYCTYAASSGGKEFRDSVNFSRKRYRKIGDFVERPLSRAERARKRKRAADAT